MAESVNLGSRLTIWPTVCPSVTIELRGAVIENTDRIMLDIACHCVVVNSAILEREKAVILDDGIHYAYLDEDGYTDEGVVAALFADCLLLGEETLNALPARLSFSPSHSPARRRASAIYIMIGRVMRLE